MHTYAVVDLETTGVFPNGVDRVVEIGLVVVDQLGTVLDEWETLIDPCRDVGPGYVHGIRAGDVIGAPRFHEIAGLLADKLAGRVLVAHNLAFDSRFLAAEYLRAGYVVPLNGKSGICTMWAAGQVMPTLPRRLADCCGQLGIRHEHAHSALGDARACAHLFARLVELDDSFLTASETVCSACEQAAWPAVPSLEASPWPRRAAAVRREQHFLERLTGSAGRAGETAEVESYLAMLDRALIDRSISLTEADALVELARELGIDRDEAVAAHERYLQALTRHAFVDGLTAQELTDLQQVAAVLGLSDGALTFALQEGQVSEFGGQLGFVPFQLQPGDQVVFTGDAGFVSRESLEGQALALGLQPHGNVTKRTRLLVAVDPDSSSGKARKARGYGIPIVGLDAWALILARTSEEEAL